MRNQKNSRVSDNYEDGIAMWARPLLWAGGTLLSRPRDSALAIAAGVAAGAIVINSLYLQPGPHPAPIFAFKRSPIAADAAASSGAVANAIPRPRPVEAAPVEQPAPQQPVSQQRAYVPPPVQQQAAAPRRDKDPIAELLGSSNPSPTPSRVASAPVPPAPVPQVTPAVSLASIQRRLAEFGYGPVAASGKDGPETRAAIESFERSHGMAVTGKVSDRLTRELGTMSGRPL